MLSAQLLASALVLLSAALVLWLASLRLADASLIDVFWGPFFLLITVTGLALVPAGDRALLVFGLVALWALRLGVHLGARAVGKGEDPRYRAMRAAAGPGFALRSLFTIYLLQVALALLVALPIHAVMSALHAPPLGLLDAAGALLSLVGLGIETVADVQLTRFRNKEEGRGNVLESGLWRYSRHPNYFGDFCFWWGLGLVSLAVAPGWALLGPLVMSVLLMRVSGVTLLERDISDRRPAYARYRQQTSAFFPWPRRSS